jgi:hypothetical protein
MEPFIKQKMQLRSNLLPSFLSNEPGTGGDSFSFFYLIIAIAKKWVRRSVKRNKKATGCQSTNWF